MFLDYIFTDLLEGICVCEYLLEGTFVSEFILQKCTVSVYVYIAAATICLDQLVVGGEKARVHNLLGRAFWYTIAQNDGGLPPIILSYSL